jgi:protein O-mannosyl-transferase
MAASPISTKVAEDVRAPRRDMITVAVLFVLAAGCYLNTLGNGFVYDDELQILQNPYVKNWHYLPQILRTTVWSFIGDAGESNYYRPLMTLTFLSLWKVFGDSPVGFHLFNILLNAVVVACVFYAGRALLKCHWAAALAAILFAVHPVHTETVDWIAAVPDLEATLFILLAFFVYVTEPWGRLKSQALAATLFVLALLAKEPALMLAPLLILYEHFVRDVRKQTTFTEKVRNYAPVCVAAAAYLGLRIALFGKLAPVLQHAQIGWREAIYSGFALVAQYTKLLIWAGPLSAFHVFHASQSARDGTVLAGMAVVFASWLFILLAYRRWPAAAFSVVWIGFTLSPVLNARWMAANVLTERYLYLPSVGFCWLVGWAAKNAWDRLGSLASLAKSLRWALCTAGIVVALLGSAKTWKRNRVWHDDLTLYAATLATDPDSYIMHMNLGTTYFATRNFTAAEKELHRALELRPDSANVLNALGCVYLEQGRFDEAAKALEKAIALKPAWSDPHFNYGRVLIKTGQEDQALAQFHNAVQVGPLNATAHLTLAEELAARTEYAEAEGEYRKSLELLPGLHGKQKLVDLLISTGRSVEAADMLREIVTEYPFDSESHLNLARILEKSGKIEEARTEYQATLQTDPANSEAHAGLTRLEAVGQKPGPP